jgi:membrane associated rhomboid family serine protease
MSLTGDLKNIFKGKNNGLYKLIAINVIVFIVCNLFMGISRLAGNSGISLYMLFGLSPDVSFFLEHFWTLLTYMFLHSDSELFHILFNMLWLYWMGQLFVEYIGSKQLISTYILGGISGGILFIIYGASFPASAAGMPLIGSSAAVMAIVVAIAFLIPNYTINVLLLGEIKLKYIAIAAFILTSMLDFYDNTGGKIAHIGGALYGYLFIVQYRKGLDTGAFVGSILTWFEKFGKPRSNLKVEYKRPLSDEAYNIHKLSIEKKTDEILDKISKSGYDSLNKEEKEFLFKRGSE